MTNRNTRTRSIVFLAATGLLLTGAMLYAGPLVPPAGPVSSTYKTLHEVEPRKAINTINTPGDSNSTFRITQPGSYYLTRNINGAPGKHGIKIEASGVTVDLNGFDVVGLTNTGGLVDGVRGVSPYSSIKVINGSVRNWGSDGINLFDVTNSVVEEVLASGNGSNGISIGICSTISNCSSMANTGYGIRPNANCTISNCAATENTLDGIGAVGACVIRECAASQNRNGIRAFIGATIDNCSAGSNSINGIKVSLDSSVASSSVRGNGASGIQVEVSDCQITDCTAQYNSQNGIWCDDNNVIRGNTCDMNGFPGTGAGVFAVGDRNRIEGNNCTGGSRGIDVVGIDNIIVQNTCRRNPINWNIQAGNSYGPTVVTPGGANVFGNSAPDTLGSTHSNANFTYFVY